MAAENTSLSAPPLEVVRRRRLYAHQVALIEASKRSYLTKIKLIPRKWLITLAVFLLVVVLSASIWCVQWTAKGKITASGGLYFFTTSVLPVPAFAQDDPIWQDDPLGPSDDTVGSAGCALTSAAMVMTYYGFDTDPRRLNDYLTTHRGYTPEGWIYWEQAAAISHGKVQKAYEDAPSYALVDENLLWGNPVIVRLHLASGMTHFVVVVGKSGWNYLIRDPAAKDHGVFPLYVRSNEVTGLRYYQRL